MGRFEVKRLSLVLEPALRDIEQAGEEREHLPALYAGLLDVSRGRLYAYTARDKKAFTTALHLITKGSYHIGASADNRTGHRTDWMRSIVCSQGPQPICIRGGRIQTRTRTTTRT